VVVGPAVAADEDMRLVERGRIVGSALTHGRRS
jgi:hypothetical protein